MSVYLKRPGSREQLCWQALIELGLAEDLVLGDVTTEAIVPAEQQGRAVMAARETLVASGLEAAAAVFDHLDPLLQVEVLVAPGTLCEPGQGLIRLTGSLRTILTGERLALNLLGRLSGIATHTRRYVELIADTSAKVVDTRKTTPGMRALEKAAVRDGGAANHRFNLGDGILIKDNHIEAAGSLSEAVHRVRARLPHHLLKLEVEVDTLEQLEEALRLGVEIVLLDNMSPAQLREAVRITAGRALLEASGGIRFDTIRAVAETGVSLISVGNLIHGARWVDVGLDVLPSAHS
ncbi:MAG: carboxylating nicotinate-nucleotide diphosphorylase [Myxococcota bacterium]